MTETADGGVGKRGAPTHGPPTHVPASASARAWAAARAALSDAFAVVAPVHCVVCGRDDELVCACCAAALGSGGVVRALVAGVPLSTRTRYEGGVRAGILAFKEQGRTALARPLGVLLRDAVADALAVAGERGVDRVEFVTVPSEPSAFRSRGFRPVPLLLEGARLPRPVEVLARARRRRDQAALGVMARAGNLEGALTSRGRLDGRRFVVIEDVVTTGATLAEVIRAIVEAGGEVVAAAALARTPKHSDVVHQVASGGSFRLPTGGSGWVSGDPPTVRDSGTSGGLR